VVLRADSIRARLRKLEEVTTHLEELGELSAEDLERDFREAWTAERGLQVGAEALFDLGNHILTAHFGTSAEDYEDILVQLGRRGVLEPALMERLRGLGGFRNVLVHGYLRLDLDKVAAHLRQAPDIFAEFTAAVRGWVEKVLPEESGA
jgi:uncharacterized protein YutE (UPF0331/DUF86 family)